jgi:putative (di)nucleoside polyphosphate hydrolase
MTTSPPQEFSHLPYRPCVGIMLINRAGLVWTGQRADTPKDAEGQGDWWQMPQGGIDEGEDPREAALRELYEETSVRSAEIIGRTSDWLLYDLPAHLIGKAWGGRYRGQKQMWFAARFLGPDSEISIVPPDGHQVEFVSWKWVLPGELVAGIVPFKRSVYEAVVRELGHHAKPAG